MMISTLKLIFLIHARSLSQSESPFTRRFAPTSPEKDLRTESGHGEEPFATKPSSFVCRAKLECFALGKRFAFPQGSQ